MKTITFGIVMACLMMFGVSAYAASMQNPPQIRWTTDYQGALQQAKQTSKPVVLFFTGSDWCTWCQKLENEVLDTSEFGQLAGDKFIFVKLDYPRRTRLDAKTEAQNKQLLNKYDIRAYPTVLLIDGQERFLGNVSYRSGGPQRFASDLSQAASKANR